MYDYKRNDYIHKYVSESKVDLDYNFKMHPITGDIAKIKDIEAIKMSLKNLIMLNHYEKPFHHNIGCDIYKSLFENMEVPGTEIVMEEYISEMINKYEPRATLKNLDIIVDSDRNNIEITIYFTPVNQVNTVTLNMFLKILR